jgi:hypothetical protein
MKNVKDAKIIELSRTIRGKIYERESKTVRTEISKTY